MFERSESKRADLGYAATRADPFAGMFRGRRVLVSAILILNAAILLFNLVPAFSLGVVIDFAITRRSMHNLWLVVAGMVVALAVESCAAITMASLTARVRKGAVADITSRVFAVFEQAPLEKLEQEPQAILGRRLRSIDRAVGFRLDWYAKTTVVPVYVASIMAFVWWKNARLALCMIGLMGCFLAAHWFLHRRLKAVVSENSKAADALSKKLQELLGGLVTLRVAMRVRVFKDAFLRLQHDLFQVAGRRALVISVIKYLTEIYSRLAVILLLLIGAVLVLHRELSVGSLIAINLVFRRMLGEVRTAVPLIQRAAQIVHETSLVQQLVIRLMPAGPPAEEEAAVPAFARIALEDVRFRYPGAARDAVRNVSFEFGKGDFVVVVGGSGDGKSSLLKLICGLYQPSSGRVKYMGGSSGARASYGLVTTSDFLFGTSVRENIELGRLLTDAEISRAVELSASGELVRGMSEGIDSELKERGSNLSSGQQQRIHLARLFAANTDLMLLDEPTSALDPGTEEMVVSALRNMAGRKTIVAVTHRVAPALAADVVVMMSNGTVVEWGDAAELRADPDSRFSAWLKTHRVMEQNVDHQQA